jgi:hypothetical protein
MTTITTLAARITVLAIQGFMLDQRRSRDGPAVPRRLTAASDLRPPVHLQSAFPALMKSVFPHSSSPDAAFSLTQSRGYGRTAIASISTL